MKLSNGVKYFVALVIAIALVSAGLYFLRGEGAQPAPIVNDGTPAEIEDVAVVAENLEIPWDIAFLPDGTMLVTERTGDVLHIDPKNPAARTTVFTVPGGKGEGGLLGILLHTNFKNNKYVYLYMSAQGEHDETVNRVVRYTFENDSLIRDREIIDGIPGATYHDGGRMEFGPDGKLYVTTGDATRGPIAQDKTSLGGKILRLNDDGTTPSDNPFGTRVWSYGHRNPQGLAWDGAGNLWETEHGPTGEAGRCCHDELNFIDRGSNYGWPTIIGDEVAAKMVTPEKHSGNDTWAPASLAYLDGALYFGALKGEALYKATLQGTGVSELKAYFKGEYGRIRTVRVGPDKMLYITTSNRDGRGDVRSGDDKIIRINPASLK